MGARAAASAAGLLLLAGAPAQGQPASREIAALRAHLELPAAVSLEPASRLELPASRPLRVRLALGLDLETRENVARWIEEWNRKQGRKRGAVEVVEEPGAAEVVLARYTERDKVRSRRVDGPDLQPRVPGQPRAPRSSFSIDVVPVHAYVIDARRPQAWRILWRHTGFTTLDETSGSGRELWDGLRALLEKRN